MNQKINEKLTEQDVKDIFKEAQIYADIYTFAVDYCSFFIIDLSDCYFSTSADIINSTLEDYDKCGQVQDYVLANCILFPLSKQAKDLSKFYQKWNKNYLKSFASFTKSELQELVSDIHDLIVRYDYYNNDRFDSELDLGAETFPEQAKQVYQQKLDELEALSTSEKVIDYLLDAGYELDDLADNDLLLEMAREKDDVADIAQLLANYDDCFEYHYIDEYGEVDDDAIGYYLYDFIDDKKDQLKDLIKLADKTIQKEN